MIYAWCLQSGLQPVDAADVGQDVFLAVARAIGDFRRDRPGDSFRGWLHTITRRKVIDKKRSALGATGVGGGNFREIINQIPDLDQESGPSEDHFSEPERVAILYRAIESVRGDFEARTVNIFLRCYLDGIPILEVAREFGVTRNVVYLAKSRVLQRLRETYQELLAFGDATIAQLDG